MTHLPTAPVVAVFPDRSQAEAAVDSLWHEGVRHNDIGMVLPGHRIEEAKTPTGDVEESAADGAEAGAIAGGAVGAFLGAAATGMIPGIGPIVAAGILTGILTGAATGATAGVFLGPFLAMGLTEDVARHCEGELSAGKTVLVVQGRDKQGEVISLLHGHGALSVTAGARSV
jgi:hypothetical protein